MKFKTKAKEFAAAVNTVLAVHDFGESSDDRQACLLTANEEGLLLESAKLGAYCSKQVDGQLLREGSVGLNAKDLANMKLGGDIVIDSDGAVTKFLDSRTAYRWATDVRASADVEDQRSDAASAPTLAKIPLGVLRAGATFATYASEQKGDYDVQVTIDKGRFEYCGVTHLGYGRYEFTDDSIKCKKAFYFILGNSILAKVLKEVKTDDVMSIGTSDDGALVHLRSPGLTLWHPAIDKRYQDTTENIQHVTGKGKKRTCHFTVQRNDLKDAVDRAAPVGKKAADARMALVISSKGVPSIRQHAQDNTAVCRFEAEDIQAKGEVKILLKAKYLKEFLKVAPSTIPLTVESWDGKFLRIMASDGPGLVDYMALMVTD